MKGKSKKTIEETQSVRISKKVAKDIKRHIIDNGGTIRSVLEHGAGIVLRLQKIKDGVVKSKA